MRCQGCEGWDEAQVGLFLVTFHDGHSEVVCYCEDCADLARIDWNGETAEIEAICTRCGRLDGGHYDDCPVVEECV